MVKERVITLLRLVRNTPRGDLPRRSRTHRPYILVPLRQTRFDPDQIVTGTGEICRESEQHPHTFGVRHAWQAGVTDAASGTGRSTALARLDAGLLPTEAGFGFSLEQGMHGRSAAVSRSDPGCIPVRRDGSSARPRARRRAPGVRSAEVLIRPAISGRMMLARRCSIPRLSPRASRSSAPRLSHCMLPPTNRLPT
jgi:hypothetical protein